MSIPKIVEHKIITLRKRDGSTQYTLTLPKEYAEGLRKEGIDTLFIIFNRGLGAFPKIRLHRKSVNHVHAGTLGTSRTLRWKKWA